MVVSLVSVSVLQGITSTLACFLIGTKILCLNKDLEEVYIPIEDLNDEYLIKTYLHGYKKIKSIGKSVITNNPNDMNFCMFKLNSKDDLMDDLYITGGHSILVDDLNEYEIKEHLLKWPELKKIDDKNLLLAGLSDKFEKICDTNEYEVYHIVCEDEGDENKQYGIYANGILAESISDLNFKQFFN